MVWGHARTKDFLNWEELPVAIAPSESYDKDGCWSGTATVKDGVLYLIYSSIVQPNEIQTVSVAYSHDGVNFEKYSGNPVIEKAPADGGDKNFRDPAICIIDGELRCIIASGNEEKKTANLLMYKSNDVFHCEYVGVAAEWSNSLCTECPSLVPFCDKYLLSASVLPFDRTKHWFSLMLCELNNDKFNIINSARVFMGPDEYAGQIFSDGERAILISWISGWNYSDFADKCIGCLSVPCEISVKNGKLCAYPVRELAHLLKDGDEAVTVTENGFKIERSGREPVEYKGDIRELKILRDKHLVEVFVNGGEYVYTAIL